MQDIETIAVSALQHRLSYISLISPFVNNKDKEPLWDGNIYVFSNKDKPTHGEVKKIPCQCKGKIINSDFKDEITYPISLDDIKNYLTDGGVMYFVVLQNETIRSEKIYFRALLPSVLQTYINQMKQKGTKSIGIKMKSLPESDNDIIDILLNFHENKMMQSSFVGNKIMPYDHNNPSKQHELILQYTTIKPDVDWSTELFNKELCAYIKPQKVGDVPTPILGSIKICGSGTVKNAPIVVGENKYYNSYILERRADNTNSKIKIGKNFEMIFKNNGEAQITISCVGSLKERIHDLTFIRELIRINTIKIGSTEFKVFNEVENDLSSTIRDTDFLLLQYNRFERVLSQINLPVDPDLDKFTTNDFNNLSLLADVMLDNKLVVNWDKNYIPTCNFGIGNYKIKLYSEYIESVNKYLVSEIIGLDLVVVNPQTKEQSTKYAYFLADDILEISNLNPMDICKDIRKFGSSPFHNEISNAMLLKMLTAYDKQPKAPLLDAIIDLDQYLLDVYNRNSISIINDAQIKIRIGNFTDDDKKLIRKIRKKEDNAAIKFGCDVILNNIDSAEEDFECMTKEEQENMKLYPIYNLYEMEKHGRT